MLKGYALNDGATYWIAAPNASVAVATWEALGRELDQVEEIADALTSGISIREMSPERMRQIVIADDGDRENRRSMWQALEQQGDTAAVLACSEWP